LMRCSFANLTRAGKSSCARLTFLTLFYAQVRASVRAHAAVTEETDHRCRAAVSGHDEDLLYSRRLGKLPGQSVFATAGANEENT